MHANRMQSMGDINIYEFNEKSQLRSPSWAKYTAIYGNWIIWELFHTTAVKELKTGMKSSGEAKLWNYEVVERVVKSSGEPKSQSYDVVEASRNSAEAMPRSCKVTMLWSCKTGAMITQLYLSNSIWYPSQNWILFPNIAFPHQTGVPYPSVQNKPNINQAST